MDAQETLYILKNVSSVTMQ